MSKKKRCIYIYYNSKGFDSDQMELLKLLFKYFADSLFVNFDCDSLKVSRLQEPFK